ncbi:hypothetical protein BDR05DRAFT_386659 [Suillus weaverae]|nr:hypothetical protein BDR05DRAFT_386659 [Suillus weaverae]
MVSESEPQTLYVTGAPCHENKQGSETLVEAYSVTKDSDPPSHSDEFPEGGLAAWTTVFGSFLVQFSGFGFLHPALPHKTNIVGYIMDRELEHFFSHLCWPCIRFTV